ncbi:4Fe-4S binding protein [Chitinimonas koreensis]|uniref:4Fe-4S binding protein n=1 Tax=Chitinimonas koreensis TaxID=356302 RepID=UPI00041D3BDB|nr:4Fe-4S binding protein [Chitinimonas koreensis]QNM95134.1 4Fe-4S binding protein [Chitinimonas koreensis]
MTTGGARLTRAGLWLRRHGGAIRAVQWAVVAVYAILLVLPALLPLPPAEAGLLDHLAGWAQLAFWGLWWPGVIASMLLLGRSWCGLLCPEGMLSEWASGHGRGRRAPAWLKWPGWPLAAFVLTTVYGQLVSVYQYPRPALLVLGGSTAAAMAVGYLYGRNKRVWCRYLCPVGGVFGLLARLAPLHYEVDRAAWDARPARSATPIPLIPVNCAPLIDIRRMDSASQCHQCGRCAGQRGAVHLAARPPGREIARLRPEQAQPWEVALLLYGLIGVAVGAFGWSGSRGFVAVRQALAGWLVEREAGLGLLADDAPWWLLTHYPALNDSFTWLDGLLIVGYIAAVALALGSALWLCLGWAARRLDADWRPRRLQLAYSLTPLAGLGLFVGLSATSLSQLRGLGYPLHGQSTLQAGLLALGLAWSLGLAWRQMADRRPAQRLAALSMLVPALVLVGAAWRPLLHI